MMVTMVQIIMRMMRIKGIITMLTLDSGGTVSGWISPSTELVGSPEDDFENQTDEHEKGANKDDDYQGQITMLTLDSGGDGFRVDFTFDRTGGFT